MQADDGWSRVFWVLASFFSDSCPRLAGVTFGVDYDDRGFILEGWGHSGDQAFPTAEWPGPRSGISILWGVPPRAPPLRAQLVEVCWFAGFPCSSTGRFELTGHPTAGGYFLDDSVPAEREWIRGYGALGFGGTYGHNPIYLLPVEETSWGNLKKLWSEDVR